MLKDGESFIVMSYPVGYAERKPVHSRSFLSDEAVVIRDDRSIINRLKTEAMSLKPFFNRNQETLNAYNLPPAHQKYEQSYYYLCQKAYQDIRAHPLNALSLENGGDFQIGSLDGSFSSFQPIYAKYDQKHPSRQSFVALMRLNGLEKISLKSGKTMWKALFSDSRCVHEQTFFNDKEVEPFQNGEGRLFMMLFKFSTYRNTKNTQGRVFVNIEQSAPLDALKPEGHNTFFIHNPSDAVKAEIRQTVSGSQEKDSVGDTFQVHLYENGVRGSWHFSLSQTPENRENLARWNAAQIPSTVFNHFHPADWSRMFEKKPKVPQPNMRVQ